MPKLKHYIEFQNVLLNYHMSERAKSVLEGLQLVLLVAPTSTGRNTIINRLVEQKDYYFVVSDTTREPQVRDGALEENGVQYFFRSEEDMLKDLKAGEFLEAELHHEQQVSGISIRELERAKTLNKVAITDVGVEGADNLINTNSKTLAVFLIPPSFDAWQDRIAKRGYMSPQELENRLSSADKEFTSALQKNYYKLVINEDINQAAEIIDSIVKGGHNPHQDRGRELIHRIQLQLQDKLGSIKHGR